METSILESIGTEILSVMTPVSICMLLVVLLVYTISTPTSSLSSVHTAATLVYLETPTDSTTQKLEGALLNAFVFILLVAALTFLLLLLYYYNYTNFLKHYMRFSAFFVLGSMGGSIFLSIVQHFSIPIDSITCYILLLNFTIVGVLSVFSRGIPIVVRQGYMIVLGIIVAAWFTKLPEWTTWVLLVALAVYDLFAVLCPGGPLKLLVELASSRDEDLPALIYEARPTMGAEDRRGSLGILVGGAMMAKGLQSIELQQIMHNSEGEDEETSPLVANSGQWTSTSSGSSEYSTVTTLRSRQHGNTESEIVGEISPLVDIISSGHETEQHARRDNDIGEEYEISMHPGIKLGLGDFVFYSVLVGRAAMYDLMTVYACYIAIISGLGCTLILLSVCRQALPALPISILLGVIFYFLTRLLMEPFIVGLSTNLIMF